MKIFKILVILLLTINCKESVKIVTPEVIESVEILSSKKPVDLIKSLHQSRIASFKEAPNDFTSNFTLKHADDYINTININKEIDVTNLMKVEGIKTKIVLYSFVLGENAFKEYIAIIEDSSGFLRYEQYLHFSTYSENYRIKSIGKVVENWKDGNTVCDLINLIGD